MKSFIPRIGKRHQTNSIAFFHHHLLLTAVVIHLSHHISWDLFMLQYLLCEKNGTDLCGKNKKSTLVSTILYLKSKNKKCFHQLSSKTNWWNVYVCNRPLMWRYLMDGRVWIIAYTPTNRIKNFPNENWCCNASLDTMNCVIKWPKINCFVVLFTCGRILLYTNICMWKLFIVSPELIHLANEKDR